MLLRIRRVPAWARLGENFGLYFIFINNLAVCLCSGRRGREILKSSVALGVRVVGN